MNALRTAWLEISDKKKGTFRHVSGTDGMSINRFAERADEHLQILSASLRGPQYQFAPLSAHVEQKPGSGKSRVICVPTIRDRIVHRSILNYLVIEAGGRYAFANDVNFGFVKKKSVRDAVVRAKELRGQYPWAYKTDIASFFDAIERGVLKQAVDKKIRCRGLHRLLHSVIDCEVKPNSSAQAKRIHDEGIRRGRGLRQGMPLSPYLSNLMLWNFDQTIVAERINMVRYADDLVFFGSSEKQCQQIHAACVSELSKIGLNVHPLGTPKSLIAGPSEPVEFLGVQLKRDGLGYGLNISNDQMDKKKSALLGMQSISGLLQQRITVSKFVRNVDSKIAGWCDAYWYCDNIGVLADKLKGWRSDLMRKVLVDELGIKNPSIEALQFLELAALP